MINEIYDVVGVARELELECEDIAEIYNAYISEINEHYQSIKEHFDKNDLICLERAIHTLKGLAGNLLIQDVFEEASSIDKQLKENNFTNLKENLERLLDLIINSEDKISRSFAEINIIL